MILLAVWVVLSFGEFETFSQKVEVNPETNTFIDNDGHTLFFHGVSQVNKEANINNGLLQ